MAKISNVQPLPDPDEYWHQCKIFEWKCRNIERLPDLEFLSGSINGVVLPVGLAVKCQKAGLVKGIPDLDLPVPMGGYYGLSIELKREKGGRLTDEQRRWLCALTRFGRYACVCHGHQAAINIIENYLKGDIIREK